MTATKPNIKFTVIIPTRERSDTLQWALKTCTAQNYDNFEIIVSDNFSQDDTQETVEANKDKRIRYINTGRRVSMSKNYEFAISHVAGDYVCIIGDDDGLMPNALRDLNEILRDTDIEAISWKKPIYIWDKYSIPNLSNTIRTSLKNKFRRYDAKKAVEELLAFKPGATITFNDLACLYHGFIKMETINKLRLPNGVFFNSMAPDVYASLVVSCSVQNLYQTEFPYTMHGISSHSTGFTSKDSKETKRFLSETDIPSHPSIKLTPLSAPLCIADCFLKLQNTHSEASKFEINIKGMVRTAIENAAALSADNYQFIADSVRHTCEVYNMQEYGNQIIAQNPNLPNKSLVITGYNFFSDYLVLKFNEDVKNIYDATVSYKKLLKNKFFAFYILESSRFLLSSIKNRGIKKSIGKGLRLVSGKSDVAS